MKTVEGVAELYWTCPYKTCETDNCVDLNKEWNEKNDYKCCHCKRITKVIWNQLRKSL